MKNLITASHYKTGFTLIELLVVLAVVGLLAALLFPVLNKAMETSRATQSLSNLSSIGKAITLYAGDNDMKLPTMTREAPWQKPYWTDMIKPYIGDREYDLSNNQDLWYRPKIYENPYWSEDQHQITADYGNNRNVIVYIDGNNEWFPSNAVRMHQIPKPSGTVMVANSGRAANNPNGPGGTWYIHTPGFLAAPGKSEGHPQPIFNDVIHALFVDGHVEAIPYQKFVEKRHDYLGSTPFNRP